MISGYYIYIIEVVEGLGSFLSGCLVQIAKYTIHNHCLSSLCATRVSILWLNCFCSVVIAHRYYSSVSHQPTN